MRRLLGNTTTPRPLGSWSSRASSWAARLWIRPRMHTMWCAGDVEKKVDTQNTATQAAPYIKQATDVAAPVVEEGAKQVQKVVEPALKAIEPSVKVR